MESIDVVVAGGASHVAALTSAVIELAQHRDIRRIGGASAGAISAAALAFGVPATKQRELLSAVLTGNKLKDRSLWPPARYGLFKGDALLDALRSIFGGARMGDARMPLRITVCDLWTRAPAVIDSEDPKHRHLRVVDVLRCSAAIPVFFKAWTLPEVWGNRLFVDGGTSANFTLGMFDDDPRRTIGLRLEAKQDAELRPVRNVGDFVGALAELVTWASDNAHISTKRFADVVRIPSPGSGFDFDLSEKEIEARWSAGRLKILEVFGAA